MIKIFTSKNQQIGQKGEEIAVTFLMKHGFNIVEQNVANKYGEIDIVAKKGSRHCFFEVKAGRRGSLFNPAENLTEAKIRKFRISVEHYCYTRNIKEYTMEGIIVVVGAGEPSVEIIPLT